VTWVFNEEIYEDNDKGDYKSRTDMVIKWGEHHEKDKTDAEGDS